MSYAGKIEDLIAERDELRRMRDAWQAEAAADLVFIAALRKDAERYRWLRAHWFRIEAMTNRDSHALVLAVTGGWPGELCDNDRLDSSIDAEVAADAARAAVGAA